MSPPCMLVVRVVSCLEVHAYALRLRRGAFIHLIALAPLIGEVGVRGACQYINILQ